MSFDHFSVQPEHDTRTFSQPESEAGRSFTPPPFQLKAGPVAQRQGEEEEEASPELEGVMDALGEIMAEMQEEEAEGMDEQQAEDLSGTSEPAIPEKILNEPWTDFARANGEASTADAQNEAPTIQQKAAPIQFGVRKTARWSDEKRKYEGNEVTSRRVSGDAEWLAIRRFTKYVDKHPGDTVRDVIDRAEIDKGISYSEWKGSQANGDSQEAQHLIPASVGRKYNIKNKYLNSPRNGKMLLAGRRGKGSVAPKAYLRNKKRLGLKPRRGIFHITKGASHPRYNKVVENLLESYARKLGKDPKTLRSTDILYIQEKLRRKHRRYDGRNTSKGVDDMQF